MLLSEEKAEDRVSMHLDVYSVIMLVTALIAGMLIAMIPNIWLWLFVPLLVSLDGVRVECSDYVKAHTWRDKFAKWELVIGPVGLIALAIVLACVQWAR